MRKILFTALAVGAVALTVSPAEARGGCGRFVHRDYYGGCVPNRVRIYGPVRAYGPGRFYGPGPFYGPGRPIIGAFYPGRGYWYGNRYWGHRYRWHGGWRYR